MRRLLAPIVVAAALVGAAAPPASAESCYGTADTYVCFAGDGPSTGETSVGTCLYTGGSACTPYYVHGVPTVSPGTGSVNGVRVCDNGQCYTRDDVSDALQRLGCRIYPSVC